MKTEQRKGLTIILTPCEEIMQAVNERLEMFRDRIPNQKISVSEVRAMFLNLKASMVEAMVTEVDFLDWNKYQEEVKKLNH